MKLSYIYLKIFLLICYNMILVLKFQFSTKNIRDYRVIHQYLHSLTFQHENTNFIWQH